MILIISEKPIAAQRISNILAGSKVTEQLSKRAKYYIFEKEGKQYTTIAMKGHITGVDFPPHYQHWIGTDLKNLANAELVTYATEKDIADFLQKIAPKADGIIVATDSDREGEAIGLEALEIVKKENPKINIERASFSAITPKDINDAFQKLAKVDYNLGESANARREIDLVWGAVLTRFLSLVSGKLGREFLSMGRVQGPTLGLVVDREKERLAFVSKPFWEIQALFKKEKSEFAAQHKKGRFWDEKEAKKAFECGKPPKGKVTDVSKKKRVLAKPIPFNTTGFLRAATAIGFSAGQAMSIAESLYQSGYISYPRTDNSVYPPTLILKDVLVELSKVAEFELPVRKLLALKALVPSRGKEAKDHPPIHPVSAAPKAKLDPRSWKIYVLVCRHFFATLAEDAETENLSVEIDLNTQPFVARGQVFTKLGWKEFYPYSKATEVLLPNLEKGDIVDLLKLDLLAKKTEPPGRYSQGSLIKAMSDLNLGTKSTRAEIIQKLYARQYISGQQAIIPSKVAFAVVDSLEKYDGKVVKPEMTAELEKEMDLVAAGEKEKQKIVLESRKFLLEILEDLLKNKASIGTMIREAARADSILGKCGKCGKDLMIRTGRTGKRFVGCTGYPSCTNTYPLPQMGKIIPTDKRCPECGALVIRVLGKGRRKFEMCLDMNCKTKEAWKNSSKKKSKKTSKKQINVERKRESIKK
ncbi:MAG: DNA topoisomerase I [Candidatus Diapherotrites archaeon]|nr:DNA topoisomerase I [Candidatus Diapherotrites archaeon]